MVDPLTFDQVRNGWGRIAVATRLEKTVDARFVVVWSHIITKGLRPGDGFLIAADKPAHKASNDVVRRFLHTDCDSLMFLDSDADVEPDFVEQVRNVGQGWKYDVLQAFYVRRGWPPQAIWMEAGPEQSTDGKHAVMDCIVTGENVTRDVALVGTHCLLVRRRVFEVMLAQSGIPEDRFDWFYYPRHEQASEDVAWAHEVRDMGFKLGATTAVKAGHICRITTGWDTYQEYVRTNDLVTKAQAAYAERFGLNGKASTVPQAV